MIKGVNRQVIEISDPNSIYYERAWLVVRPEYVRIQQSVLDKEAKSLMKDIGRPSCMGVKRSFGFWALRLGFSALIGAGISTLIHCFVL
ncbi:MAG: hypothetical protein IJ298_00290 [Ruminococcus sp.]|nr:hypothetical protein [Ruminococcus sp.]